MQWGKRFQDFMQASGVVAFCYHIQRGEQQKVGQAVLNAAFHVPGPSQMHQGFYSTAPNFWKLFRRSAFPIIHWGGGDSDPHPSTVLQKSQKRTVVMDRGFMPWGGRFGDFS
jgi:hypothetical protein